MASTSASRLSQFARQHRALLDALAATWSRAGRFSWRGRDGDELYAAGQPAGDAVLATFAYGTLSVDGADVARQPLLDAQARLLQEAVAQQAEIGLLTEDLMRTTDQLVALYEVSAAARAGRDLDQVMRTCLEQAARLTGARQACLVIREAEGDGEDAAHAFTIPDLEPRLAGLTPLVLAALSRTQEAVIANSPAECAALLGSANDAVSRIAAAPMTIGGQLDAALCVLNKPTDFISGDLKLIVALADAAAGFLERDRNYRRELAQARLRRELEIASYIQSRLLLQEVPKLPGAQIAAFSRPASEVGGDFYDVQVLPSGDLALAIGDVTGRGVPAALFMTMARILLRVGLQATHSPAEAVKQVNAGLTDDLSNAGMLLTLFAATFDPVSRQLSAMNCGHGPVLVHRHGATEVWEADGPPVGMLPQLMSVERTLTLDRHDILVVMSDGFSEARDAQGKRVGIAPLVETLQRAAAGDAAVIAAAFQDVVAVGEGGAAAEDDQTLIVLKVE